MVAGGPRDGRVGGSSTRKTELRLCLLGSPLATVDGRPLALRRRASLALLAYLALSGRPHRREVLATFLAGDASETRANKLLSNVLTDLRGAVGPYVAVTRQTVAFEAGLPHWIDVATFRAHLADGGRAGLEAATRLYQDELLTGLTLRDSPAFEEWLRAERSTLTGALTGALQGVLDEHVRRRETDAGISAARRLLALEPWREEAHRQLMLLLARSGQRSAALAQYESCRRSLDEDLGAEPARETVALYQRLAAGPRQAPVEGPGADPPPHTPPLTLPALPPAGPCVGRETELAHLAAHLADPSRRLVTLMGLGGAGKTHLALAGIRGCARVVFVSLGGAPPLAPLPARRRILGHIGDALGLSHLGDGAGAEEAVTAALRERVELLVLDGMEHLRSGAAVLSDLLRGAPRLRILTTSRTRLGLVEEWRVEVRGLRLPEQPEGLDEAPAGALLLAHARQARAGRPLDPADRPHVYRLCHLLGGLPLALIQAAEWLRLLPPAELVADVERGLDPGPAGARGSHPEPWRSLHTALEDAWHRLTPDAQGVLRRLAVFAGPFARSAAVSVAGATPDTLLALADGALLEPDGHGRYALPEPVRRYAEARLREHAREWEAARERHAGYYEAFLTRRRPALGREGCALREVGQELPDLRTAFSWAAAGEGGGLLDSLAEGLGVYYSLVGHFEAGAGLLEGVAAGRPWLQLEGARLRVRRGQPETAGRHVQGARVAARRGADRRLALAVLATAGEVLVESGRASAGRHELEQALALASESGLHDEQTAIRLALGQALAAAGEPALARAQGERVRRRARRQGARLTECRAHLLLGEVAVAQGDYDRAEGAHEEALHLAQQVGARPEEAAALLAMGIVQDEGHGQHALGGRLLQEAYTLAGSLDDRFAARTALVSLARNARRRGQSSRARALVGRALDTAREGIGDPLPALEGAALCELGAQALDAGEEGQALDLARRALETLEGLDLPAQQRLAFLVLGAALLALGQAAAAGGAYRRALLLGRATGAWHVDGDALAGLARAAMAQGAQEEALGHVAEIMERFALDAARIALRGSQSPAAICLACYEVLHAAGDREASGRRRPRRRAPPAPGARRRPAPGRAARLSGGRSRSADPLAGLGGRPGRRPPPPPGPGPLAALLPGAPVCSPAGPSARPGGAAARPLTSGARAAGAGVARPEGDAVLKRTSPGR